MIVDERIITFINSMDTENSEILETIEQEALAADVPIIRREMQSFLEVLLLMKKPMRVLEVGTAVGFSALLMSDYLPEGGHITTIENYEKRIPIARENFRRAGKKEMRQKYLRKWKELLILSLWMPRKGNIFIIFRMCCDCFRMEAVLCLTM